MERILVSACLLGAPVRYDGRGKPLAGDWLAKWSAEGRIVTLCPELAGGFTVPRAPAEIAPGDSAADILSGDGTIFDMTGQDVTKGFLDGAREAVRVAKQGGCRYALLTDGSPSCGVRRIYSGHFDGMTQDGQGVVAAALKVAGLSVFAHHDVARLAKVLDDGAPV